MTTDFLDFLCARRSIRAYRPDQITREELDAVLRAGTFAPSGRGAQSAVIVAVQDRATRDLLSALNADVLGRAGDPFYGAPTVAVVFADPAYNTYLEDGSLVMGNMLNAAYAIGLGSCWIHRAKEVFETPRGKALMREWGLKESLVGIGNCILGYADVSLPEPAPRKDGYILYR